MLHNSTKVLVFYTKDLWGLSLIFGMGEARYFKFHVLIDTEEY